eukprot:gene6238-8593_t
MADIAFTILIKTISNEVIPVRIPEGDSAPVITLKSLIKDATSIQEDRQRLIYRGRVLADECAVRDYRIEDGHTVHMVARPINHQELRAAASANTTTNSISPVPVTRQSLPLSGGAGLLSSLLSGSLAVANNSTNAHESQSMGPTIDNSNLEHIRQGLLTMHTLLSTIDISAFTSPSNPLSYPNNENNNYHELNAKPPSMRSPPENINIQPSQTPSVINSSRRFFIGQWLDVKDTVSQWLEATVMDINYQQRTVFVHYNGWPERWDEWIPFHSDRISPFRSRTSHSIASAIHSSPTPNAPLTRPPLTGSNDIRTILPELASMFNKLHPIINEAAELSKQSLMLRPLSNDVLNDDSSRSSSNAMPWDDVIRLGTPSKSEEKNSSQENEVDFKNDSNSGHLKSDEKYDSKSDHKSFSTPARTNPSESGFKGYDNMDEAPTDSNKYNVNHSIEHIDSRLRYLARELCPLSDRFGRILVDMAPKLKTMSDANDSSENNNDSNVSSNRINSSEESQASFEASILSLLRNRHPSPPPDRAYRSPISTINSANNRTIQTINAATLSGARASTANSIVSGIIGELASAQRSEGSGSSSLGHHLDIHIAILSPPQRSQPTSEGVISQLTSSLQAQAQSISTRTQELSERVAAVSGYSSTINELLRSVNAEEVRASRRRIAEIAEQLHSLEARTASTALSMETSPMEEEEDEEDNHEPLDDLTPSLTLISQSLLSSHNTSTGIGNSSTINEQTNSQQTTPEQEQTRAVTITEESGLFRVNPIVSNDDHEDAMDMGSVAYDKKVILIRLNQTALHACCPRFITVTRTVIYPHFNVYILAIV